MIAGFWPRFLMCQIVNAIAAVVAISHGHRIAWQEAAAVEFASVLFASVPWVLCGLFRIVAKVEAKQREIAREKNP